MVTNEMILAFLSVLQHGNLTAAARSTYTTQSNLSKQIAALEKELGVPLLIRAKGHNEVSLTPHGKEFQRLAREWQSLQKEFDSVRNFTGITEVSIGALDRINTFMFTDLYNDILCNHKHIRLDIHTRHSKDIYRMMFDNQLDIGLASSLLPGQNIKITPLFYETVLLVTSTKLAKPIIAPNELDPAKEIYSRWSDAFEIWHDQIWPGKQYHMHVGTASMIPSYLKEEGWWSLIPVSLIHALTDNHHFYHYQLSEDVPKRTIYMLTRKEPRPSRQEAVQLLETKIIEHLENDPLIEMIGKD